MPVDRPDHLRSPAAPGGLDRRLAAAIVEFNCLPSRYAHDSWFTALPHGALLLRLRESPRVAQRLSRHLLAAWGLEGQYCFDFSAPATRLDLLDSPTLTRLVLYAGLQCLAASLKGRERALRRRLLFKFPQGWAASFASSKAMPPPAASARLFDQLLWELAPQWAHLAA